MSDNGREDEELGMSIPTDEEDGPVLMSHDPETGMGTFSMPDSSTVDVHLPSAGIIPHPTVPVIPSSPASRVPIAPVRDWVTDSSRFPQSEDLSTITAAPVVPRGPSQGAPPSIALTPEQVRVRQAMEQQRIADAAEAERRRVYREQTIPAWREREAQRAREREDAAEIEMARRIQHDEELNAQAQAREDAAEQDMADRIRIEEEHGRTADQLESERQRAAARGFQDAQIEDYNRAQDEERRAMEDITAAPQMPLAPDTRVAETTVIPDSIGITRNPDGSVIYTDANGHEISRTSVGPDGIIARQGHAVPSGHVAQLSGQGTTINPDGSYTFTDEHGNQYRFDSEGNPLSLSEAHDTIVARPLVDHEDLLASRHVPVDRQTESARRAALIDRLEGRTSPEDEATLASVGYGESVEPSTQFSQGPLMSVPPSMVGPTLEQARPPIVGPTLAQAGLTAADLAARRRRAISSAPRQGGRGGQGISPAPIAPSEMTNEQFIDSLTNRPRVSAPEGGRTGGVHLPQQSFEQTIQGLAGRPPQREPDLIERQYNVEAKRAELAGQAARMQADAQAEFERQRQQLERERQQAMQQASRRYQDAIDRVASFRVEPTRFFQDRGAAGVIAATIAVGLGALGNVFTGNSQNAALEQINRSVDRDIEAQQAQFEGLRSAAGMQHNMFDIMRQQFSDRQAALDATRAGMLQQVALQIQQQEAGLSDATAQNNAQQLRQQLQTQAEEARQAAIEAQSQQDLRTAQAQRLLAQGEHEMALTDEVSLRNARRLFMLQHPELQHRPDAEPVTTAQMESYQRQIEAHVPPAIAARQSFSPNQFYYNNPPPQAPITGPERQHLEELNTALQQFRDNLQRDENGDIAGFGATGLAPSAIISQEGRRNRRLFENLVNAFAHARTGAAMTDEEQEEIQNILGGNWYNTDADLEAAVNDIVVPIVENALSRQANSTGQSRSEEEISSVAPGAREI